MSQTVQSNINTVNTLHIFYVNIQSIRKHFDDLSIFINNSNLYYNVIILSEVWIFPDEVDRYRIPGYNMLLQPRLSDRSGGVIIYLEETLHYSYQLVDLQTAQAVQVNLSVCVDNSTIQMSIFGVYRDYRVKFSDF